MISPQRSVQANILRAEELPAIQIKIHPQFTYVGSTSFILYDIAHVEQHHFIVTDAQKRVQRRLWFQFEGYLDDNKRKYNYSGMEVMTLGGFTFLHNSYVMNVEEAYRERPTSDSAHVVDYLNEQGYVLSGDIMSKRMVWLDDDLRNELMIIYSEILGPTGYRVSDLAEGGPSATEWPALSQALHERALASFTILSSQDDSE
jgi:hypothetical protein